MPQAAKVLCRGGCGRPVIRGYCDACQGKGTHRWERKSSAARGYDYRWQQYRKSFISDHPICSDPDKRHPGVLKPTTDVDHIVAVDGPDDPRFWDPENHQPLCHACHSYKTVQENRGFGNAPRGGAGQILGSNRS